VISGQASARDEAILGKESSTTVTPAETKPAQPAEVKPEASLNTAKAWFDLDQLQKDVDKVEVVPVPTRDRSRPE